MLFSVHICAFARHRLLMHDSMNVARKANFVIMVVIIIKRSVKDKLRQSESMTH